MRKNVRRFCMTMPDREWWWRWSNWLLWCHGITKILLDLFLLLWQWFANRK